MMLPKMQTTILTDDETALYALAGRRCRRRRRIARALWCLRYSLPTATAVVAIVAMLEAPWCR